MPSATTVTKGIRGDFGWFFGILSSIMTAFAIANLVRHAFVTRSLSAPMKLIMDAYNEALRLLVGWTEPYVQAELTWLGSFIGWYPLLQPHWRDAFVLIGLMTAAGGRVLRRNEPETRVLTVAACTIVGSYVGAVVVGLLPLWSTDQGVQELFLYVPFAAAGMALAAASREVPFGGKLVVAVVLLLVGVLCYVAPDPLSVPGLGIFVIAFVLLAMGVSAAGVGILAIYFPKKFGEDDPNFGPQMLTLGLTIVGGYAGALAFFAIDAGLRAP